MSDDTKALPHVVTGLIAKRAEIAGEIENMQAQLKAKVIELDHVEACIRIFKPDIDVEEIAPRKVPTAHHAFRGEVSRIILEALRTTTLPLSTGDLTERVMRERGLDVSDASLKRTMSRRVGACLNHWRRVRGIVKSMPGPGQQLLWEIGGR